jgi:hypothetical protein
MSAKGTTRGILVGCKIDIFEIVSLQYFEYCAIAFTKNLEDSYTWRLIVVYGSPYEEGKIEFISELHRIMALWCGPTLVGGDFNVVRSQKEEQWGD